METKTIELGGQLYEIRLIEPLSKPGLEPTLPTLQEVFNKVQPKCYIAASNSVIKIPKYLSDSFLHQNQLSTERQCKRIQALIALQNIADYYNQEVDYRGDGWYIYHSRRIAYTVGDISLPIFKDNKHANLAIEILRNASLLENL